LGAAAVLVMVASLGAGGQPRLRASGADTTPERAAALADAAATDDAALAELRTIETVDDRPVDLRAATRGIDDAADRAERLEALAQELRGGDTAGGAGGVADDAAARARADARSVLDGDEYRHRSPPRPFRGVLRWLGDRLAPVGRALGAVFGPPWRALADLPGGELLAPLAVGGLVALAVVALAQRRGRVRIRDRGRPGGLVDPAADPDALEAEAEAAEAAGDLDLAIRRRYEAGLVRLVRAGRLDLRPDTTPSRVAAMVADPPIAALTRTFEEVVYGGRPATASEVAEARAGWAALLGAGSRR
jgi:hypothetical protein